MPKHFFYVPLSMKKIKKSAKRDLRKSSLAVLSNPSPKACDKNKLFEASF